MEELLKEIKESGLQKKYIAGKIGKSPQHFSMMLHGKSGMDEELIKRVKSILKQAKRVN